MSHAQKPGEQTSLGVEGKTRKRLSQSRVLIFAHFFQTRHALSKHHNMCALCNHSCSTWHTKSQVRAMSRSQTPGEHASARVHRHARCTTFALCSLFSNASRMIQTSLSLCPMHSYMLYMAHKERSPCDAAFANAKRANLIWRTGENAKTAKSKSCFDFCSLFSSAPRII